MKESRKSLSLTDAIRHSSLSRHSLASMGDKWIRDKGFPDESSWTGYVVALSIQCIS